MEVGERRVGLFPFVSATPGMLGTDIHTPVGLPGKRRLFCRWHYLTTAAPAATKAAAVRLVATVAGRRFEEPILVALLIVRLLLGLAPYR